jgi:hypothetical protein
MPSPDRRAIALLVLVAFALTAATASAQAVERRGTPVAASSEGAVPPPTDRLELSAHGETYLQLFRRALLPGPNGALVEAEEAAPLHQYVGLEARDIDTPWRKDSVDLELSSWGRAWLGRSELEPSFDGDVQTASLRYHQGPFWVRLGRQQAGGGAARFARFDGVMLGAEAGLGWFAAAYGGFTVLPRWNQRPGYHHLGNAADSLLRDPQAEPTRSGNWVTGGRLGYGTARLSASASAHEERDAALLSHRSLGIDGRATLSDRASSGGSALVELDARRLANARLWLDTTPHPLLDVSAEFFRVEPALLLSRQSVLSVFSTANYSELGGSATWRALPELRLETNGYVELYHAARAGARSEVALRLLVDRSRQTLLRVAYARVLASDNGYHSVRLSLSRQLQPRLLSTLEAYGYFYDRPILGYVTSSVYAGTLAYQALDALDLMLGGSVAHTPYAAFDAEAMLRVSYAFDAAPRRNRW